MKKFLAIMVILFTVAVAIPNLTDARSHSSNDDYDDTCNKCGGWGDCRTCRGHGYVEKYDGRGHTFEVECEDCRGSGKCSRCKGYGRY